MAKKVVAKKGYTIEVTSWENDGDNYNTKRMTVDNKEYALAILDMCKTVFASCNNGKGGIGNMNGGESDGAPDIIMNYLVNYPIIKKGRTDQDEIIDMVMDINYELMGSTEWYYSRVFEKGIIFYSPEDVEVEEIS